MPGWLFHTKIFLISTQPFAHMKSPLSQSNLAAIALLTHCRPMIVNKITIFPVIQSLFFKVAMNILNSGRFGIGAGAGGGLRKLIGNMQSLATDYKIQINMPCTINIIWFFKSCNGLFQSYINSLVCCYVCSFRL